MKYREKEKIIDAFRPFVDAEPEWYTGLPEGSKIRVYYNSQGEVGSWAAEGNGVAMDVGSWLIRDTDGVQRGCSEGDFKEHYEKAPENELERDERARNRLNAEVMRLRAAIMDESFNTAFTGEERDLMKIEYNALEASLGALTRRIAIRNALGGVSAPTPKTSTRTKKKPAEMPPDTPDATT